MDHYESRKLIMQADMPQNIADCMLSIIDACLQEAENHADFMDELKRRLDDRIDAIEYKVDCL